MAVTAQDGWEGLHLKYLNDFERVSWCFFLFFFLRQTLDDAILDILAGWQVFHVKMRVTELNEAVFLSL